jgi:hypothetical protein
MDKKYLSKEEFDGSALGIEDQEKESQLCESCLR